MTTLRLTDVSVLRGQRRVIDRVTASAGAAETVALIGPNGAGKSTLLQVLAGVIRPASGRVELDGRPPAAMTGPERRKKLSLLSQEGGAEPTLTVEELVGLTADLPGIEGGTDRVTEALQAVGLEALRSRRLHTLSGGELQRARLARVWAQNAAVVLLDEPTAAQDIEGAARWAAAVSRLRSRQRLVVVAMHDLSLAARVCDRWWLLSGGSLVAEGRPDDLLGSGAVERVFCDAVEVSRVGTQWWVRPRLPPAGGAE